MSRLHYIRHIAAFTLVFTLFLGVLSSAWSSDGGMDTAALTATRTRTRAPSTPIRTPVPSGTPFNPPSFSPLIMELSNILIPGLPVLPPPIPNQQSTELVASPSVVPTEFVTCDTALPSRLIPGEQGRRVSSGSSKLRAEPFLNAIYLAVILGDGEFDILYGPICEDGYAWWSVRYNNRYGWVAESSATEYWLEAVEN